MKIHFLVAEDPAIQPFQIKLRDDAFSRLWTEYHYLENEHKESRIRNFDSVFFNQDTGERIPIYHIHKYNHVGVKESNYSIQTLKEQCFIQRRYIQRMVLNKYLLEKRGVNTRHYKQWIKEALEELSAMIC